MSSEERGGKLSMDLQNLQPVVVSKNVVNVHLEPAADTEQVTQAILGQPAWVIEARDRWYHVQLWDTYRGWLQQRFVTPLEKGQEYPGPGIWARVSALIADLRKQPRAGADLITKLVVSTRLEWLEKDGAWTRVRLPGDSSGWLRSSDLERLDGPLPEPARPPGAALVRTAKRLIGTPYLWGGTTPFGIDCSGFVQLVYALNGWTLLRDAGIQASDPRARPADPDHLRAGDLVFFCGATDERRERITHVGMYIGGGEFIHSAGQSVGVTISPLFSGYYWDVFWGARRMTRVPEEGS